MVTSYVFVNVKPPRNFAVISYSQPMTRGFVIDKFDHEEGMSKDEVLEIAMERNGPFTMMYSDGAGETFKPTNSDLDEAVSYGDARHSNGNRGHRLVTSRGAVIKDWTGNK